MEARHKRGYVTGDESLFNVLVKGINLEIGRL